ncbi:Separin [Branchiostoma belcheri]|nr:Separin [Branchiostoma belcheri]
MALRIRTSHNRLVLLVVAMMAAYFSLYLMVLRIEHLEQQLDRKLSSQHSNESTAVQNPPHRSVPVDPRSFNFTIHINNHEACQNGTVFLLILVTTAPQNHRNRYEIRQTWGNVTEASGVTIKTVFVTGKPQSKTSQEALERENALHQDIVQGDFLDSYRNLTLKTILCLRWASQYCPQARYVMKADDDTFVSMFTLVKHLQTLPSGTTDLVTGWVYENRAPLRDPDFIPKWYVSKEEYHREVFPKYPAGFAYVMSNDTVLKIYQVALDIKYLFLEDVYIGLCMEKLGISPVHHSGFFPEFVPIPSCKVDWPLASHWVKDPEIMLNNWANRNADCDTEMKYATMYSAKYNSRYEMVRSRQIQTAISTLRYGRGWYGYGIGSVLLLCVVTAWFSLSQRLEHPKHKDLHNGLALHASKDVFDRDASYRDGLSSTSSYVSHNNPWPHPYAFILNNPDKCKGGEDVFILIIVSTKHLNHRQRYEIRQTWGKETNVPGVSIRVVFAVGLVEDVAIQKALEHENKLHKDFIQADFMDNHRNRTLKTIMSLKWAVQFCPQARFVLKANDDAFVNIFSLVKFLKDLHVTKFITERVFNKTKPVRDIRFVDRWYVSKEEFSREIYPQYPGGFAYVMTNDTANLIYRTSLITRYLLLEDVYVGICLEQLGIVPVHHTGFYPWYVDVESCNTDWLVASQWVREPEAMVDMWNSLTSNCPVN